VTKRLVNPYQIALAALAAIAVMLVLAINLSVHVGAI
jgi:hypothetical protein